ncbi:flavohemoglobin expression-modulating QEGLA motif protein [Shewanella marina]|uniref:flavohemoglobin expression-modulating QEGLA motif protein n=1 Tax=Shewanella marina TaxID=487319 RepID=UPI00046FAD8D|nr:flavohemoglobin expression-modulating QEGLA motif protein [Shewanella marina]
MKQFTEAELIKAIRDQQPIEGMLENGQLYIHIRAYVPWLGIALHAGEKLPENLVSRCALTEAEVSSYSALGSEQFIRGFPICIAVQQSSLFCDLDKPVEEALTRKLKQQKLWLKPLTAEHNQQAEQQHKQFYRIVSALMTVLEAKFKRCLAIDLRSQMLDESQPTFKLDYRGLNTDKWDKTLNAIEQQLGQVELNERPSHVAVMHRGTNPSYLQHFFLRHFKETLLLPISVQQMYIDADTGNSYPLVQESLAKQLHELLSMRAQRFVSRHYKNSGKVPEVFSRHIEPLVLQVDKQLAKLQLGLNTLHYVNPLNYQQEKKRFLAKKGRIEPNFSYRPLKVDPYAVKEKLYQLPVSSIQDPTLRYLYRAAVNDLAAKVELLTAVGTQHFLYNSLRYYGEPTEIDKTNARFLAYAPNQPAQDEPLIQIDKACDIFADRLASGGFNSKVVRSNRLVANAMVEGGKMQVHLNQNINVTAKELDALYHHEVGIHLVTSLNTKTQALTLFKSGLTNYTMTQEGLAIYSEYMSGNLSVKRLRVLAYRVLAVEMMLKGASFCETYQALNQTYQVDEDLAFTVTARVYRGGGYTKDYVYLSGFRQILALAPQQDMSALYCGKMAMAFLPELNQLMDQGVLVKPKFMPTFIACPEPDDAVIDYLVSSIR